MTNRENEWLEKVNKIRKVEAGGKKGTGATNQQD